MANRTQLKGVKKSRSVGHRPKRNKKSVKERHKLRMLEQRKNPKPKREKDYVII